MKNLLSILTAALLMTNCAYSLPTIGPRDGLRINSLTLDTTTSGGIINNENIGPGNGSGAVEAPFANVTFSLPPISGNFDLVSDKTLRFDEIQPSTSSFFALEGRHLVLKKAGLYVVNYFINIENTGASSVAGVYGSLNRKIIPGTSTFARVRGGRIATLSNSISFTANAGDDFRLVFSSPSANFKIPKGPALEGLTGPIITKSWHPFSFAITYLGAVS